MRLLSKQDLNAKKAQEKRVEVEEGVKLAKKIDSLRQTLAEEELSLTTFRSKTVAAIHTEIALVAAQRDSLLSEVRTLRKEILDGHDAVDARKAELILYAEELGRQSDLLEKRIEALKKLTLSVKQDAKQAKEDRQRANYLVTVIRETLATIQVERESSIEVVKKARMQLDRSSALYDEVYAELEKRDMAVAAKEREISIKEERLALEEKANRTLAIKLRDREATLEREFNRLKKK